MLYTKLDEKSIQQILQQFDITPVISWCILEGGSENTNHILETAQRKYVLTLCERKTFAEATILVDLLKHLENHQFKTTKVVPNKAAKNISFFENKPIILKEYIVGEIIENHTNDLLKKIGTSIAQLHLIPAPDFLPKVYSCGQEVFSELKDTKHPFVDWLNEMHSTIQKKLNSALPKALIHGDIFFSNVIIDPQEQPIIFDFEEACYYYRIYDIGMAIVGLCNQQGKIDWTKVENLVSGYEQITPLLKEEKDALKFYITYAATSMAFWRFRQFNILAPTPSRKDSYLELKNIADDMSL